MRVNISGTFEPFLNDVPIPCQNYNAGSKYPYKGGIIIRASKYTWVM